MKKLVGLAVIACLAAPSAGLAKKPPPGNPASASCKSQLVAMGSANFKTMYGNMGGCVSKMSKTSAAQRQELLNAAKRCKAEQGTSDSSRAAFKAKYGTNGKPGTPGYRSNAFGKCVSAGAKAQNGGGGDQESAKKAQGDFTFSASGVANRHVVFDVKLPSERGTLSYSDGTSSYTVRVDCVLIAGSSVTIGGLVQNAVGFSPALATPTYLLAKAVDNGASGDLYNGQFVSTDPCAGGLGSAAPSGGLFAITSGSITVGR